MKIWTAVTDIRWYQHLEKQRPPVVEVNFWVPGGKPPFTSLDLGSPFFFKLKLPINRIAGMGLFAGFYRTSLRDA